VTELNSLLKFLVFGNHPIGLMRLYVCLTIVSVVACTILYLTTAHAPDEAVGYIGWLPFILIVTLPFSLIGWFSAKSLKFYGPFGMALVGTMAGAIMTYFFRQNGPGLEAYLLAISGAVLGASVWLVSLFGGLLSGSLPKFPEQSE
jgi:hypothetical protein